MACDVDIEDFSKEDGSIAVSDKYKQLMQDTLSDESLYTRAKDTIFYQFNDLQLTEKEKAGFVTEFMAGVTTELSKAAMATSLSWAKEERDGPYTLAKLKADASNSLATFEKIKEEICVLQKEDELKCIQIETTGAQSIRENGRVENYKIDEHGDKTCHPLDLKDEGLKYTQTKQVAADAYKIFADAYRKSGVVQVGTDTDGITKGLTGTSHDQYGEVAGYTAQQTSNAERQRIAYEDSKLNHAANSSASMIGQMLSAEVDIWDSDVAMWRQAVNGLLTKHSTTSTL